MRETIAGEAHGAAVRDGAQPAAAPWAFTVGSALLSLAMGVICYLVTGVSLDLFIGGIFIAALVVPPCSAIDQRSIIGICASLAGTWWMAVHREMISIGQWSICAMVLASFGFLLLATVRLLIRLKFNPVVASAIVTLLSLAWLTWPVWLCSVLVGSRLHWSVVFHPTLVINHIVSNLGIWTEQPVAYGLTNLGQDVQYQLPTSAWPLVALQSGVAIVMSLSFRGKRKIPPMPSAAL